MGILVSNIIKQVRWCVDEEQGSTSDYEDKYFDNITKAKIGASLRWCALYADTVLLNDKSSSSTDTTLATDYTINVGDSKSSPEGITYDKATGYVTLTQSAIRVSRVKCTGWNKGVSSFVEEDSDEYLMQKDTDGTATATADRPVVAMIRTNPLKIELFPHPTSGTIEVSLVNAPVDTYDSSTSTDTEIDVPSKMQDAFIYYLAYLVMCAHGDYNKASAMLTIAKQQIAITNE